MTTPKTAIENQIRAIMKASADLASVKAFVRGMAITVPNTLYPLVEILVESETTTRTLSGNAHERVYEGVISLSVLIPDQLAVVDREADIESYSQIADMVNAITNLFKEKVNRDLAGLTFPSGYVIECTVGRSPIEYGINNRDARTNNYENNAVIPIEIRTMERFS